VHQAFGRNYQLPNSTAHNETCAAIGSVLWNWRMLLITAEARFADLAEHTLYNSVLAGVSLDGTRFFYTNTLRNLEPMPAELRWPRQRQASLGCFCCPPNVARTIARASQYAYAQSERGVWCVLYGGSRLETRLPDGAPLALSQQTDYPWDGRVAITIESAPETEFSLLLRIPAWAAGASMRVNGAPPESATPESFHELRRTWSSGDRVELDLPMPPRYIEAHPYVEEARNQVAVMRGPIVYCLESTDLPEGVRVLDVMLRAEGGLVVGERNHQLGDVSTLRATALAVKNPAGDWSKQLYREFSRGEAHEFQCVLVPYFTWGNRSSSEMTVWMPVARQGSRS
jgi:DUF1680 family protein